MGRSRNTTRARGVSRGFPALAILSLALGAGCGPSATPADVAQRDIADDGQRLLGNWVLVQFQPDTPLEPMLAQLLAFQIGHLTAQFDGGRMVASGVGVQATRTYRIHEAEDTHFKMTLYDETGVPYESEGDFDGNLLHFQGLTPPWTGRGTLQRAAPPNQ